jgi:hypothetical protein
MRLRALKPITISLVCGLLLLATACQQETPTVVYIVLSPTPETPIVTAEPTAEVTALVTQEPDTDIPPTVTAAATAEVRSDSARTNLPPGFPTPVVARIQVVEQLFERGRLFWLEPNREIWVLIITEEGRGTWAAYEDSWVEGTDPESDAALTAPDGLIQPIRGFGKIWRETPGLRDALGWAVTPEFGYLSDYEYRAGGSVDANGQYTAGPGYHILYSLYSEQFRFNEIDATWQLGGG